MVCFMYATGHIKLQEFYKRNIQSISSYEGMPTTKMVAIHIIASLEISSDRNFWLAKVAGHGRKKFGQFGMLGLELL